MDAERLQLAEELTELADETTRELGERSPRCCGGLGCCSATAARGAAVRLVARRVRAGHSAHGCERSRIAMWGRRGLNARHPA